MGPKESTPGKMYINGQYIGESISFVFSCDELSNQLMRWSEAEDFSRRITRDIIEGRYKEKNHE